MKGKTEKKGLSFIAFVWTRRTYLPVAYLSLGGRPFNLTLLLNDAAISPFRLMIIDLNVLSTFFFFHSFYFTFAIFYPFTPLLSHPSLYNAPYKMNRNNLILQKRQKQNGGDDKSGKELKGEVREI